MPSGRQLSNDDFFLKLAELFNSRQTADHGSVFLTQKRLTSGNLDEPYKIVEDNGGRSFVDRDPPEPLPVLIRASNGNSKKEINPKVKLSTVVQPDQIEKFYIRFGEVCKTGMQGLKKRDRSGRKKAGKGKTKRDHPGEKRS